MQPDPRAGIAGANRSAFCGRGRSRSSARVSAARRASPPRSSAGDSELPARTATARLILTGEVRARSVRVAGRLLVQQVGRLTSPTSRCSIETTFRPLRRVYSGYPRAHARTQFRDYGSSLRNFRVRPGDVAAPARIRSDSRGAHPALCRRRADGERSFRRSRSVARPTGDTFALDYLPRRQHRARSMRARRDLRPVHGNRVDVPRVVRRPSTSSRRTRRCADASLSRAGRRGSLRRRVQSTGSSPLRGRRGRPRSVVATAVRPVRRRSGPAYNAPGDSLTVFPSPSVPGASRERHVWMRARRNKPGNAVSDASPAGVPADVYLDRSSSRVYVLTRPGSSCGRPSRHRAR